MSSGNDVSELFAGSLEGLKPAQRMTPIEAMERYLHLHAQANKSGPYSSSLAPVMREPANSFAERRYQVLAYAGPARSGKTQALIDGLWAYTQMCDPGDAMILQMSEGAARYYSRARIGRTIRISPELNKRLGMAGSDDNVFDKYFTAGNFLAFGYPAISILSGRDFRYMFISDLDRMPTNVNDEGPPEYLAFKRTETYMSRGMSVAECSPGFPLEDDEEEIPAGSNRAPKVAHGIMPLYNSGTMAMLHLPCGKCGNFFKPLPSFEALYWPTDGRLTNYERGSKAELICTRCGMGNSTEHRRDMLANHRWVHEGQTVDAGGVVEGARLNTDVVSYWQHGVTAAFTTWQRLVTRYLNAVEQFEATGESGELKKVITTDFGFPFSPPRRGKKLTPASLISRAKTNGEDTGRVVNEGIKVLTATVDVQAGARSRFEVQFHGWREGLESELVDYFTLEESPRGHPNRADPASWLEDWELLKTHVLDRTYPIVGTDMQMRATAVGVDMHGAAGVSANAYAFWRALSQDDKLRLLLLRGSRLGMINRVKLTYPNTADSPWSKNQAHESRGDVPVLQLASNDLKDIVMANIGRDEPGPGFVTFPKWLPEPYFKGLLAETRNTKGKWENLSRKPNEPFDLMAYQFALAFHLQLDQEAVWQRHADLSRSAFVISPNKKPQSATNAFADLGRLLGGR